MKAKSDTLTISSLDSKADEKFIPTGVAQLDAIIGGGVYRGRITELWGQEAVGKTHLVSLIMANLSKEQTVLFIDTEFALNRDRVKELGADPANIKYVASSHLEEVCELIVREAGNYDVIILDSLAYLTPLTVDTNQIGETSIGLFARLIKHWVVKFRPRLGASKTAFIAINQYRAAVGLYAKTEPPGGKAWLHAVDVRVSLTTNSQDKITEGGKQIGHWVHASVKKSKVSIPHQETKFKLIY
jgi:recombination protein RecA